jgi:sigma-54-interacting transcriptional regulator
MTRAAGRETFEPDVSRVQIRSRTWGDLALDIHVAARSRVPVLISAPPACAMNVARAIVAFAGASKAMDVVAFDCAGGNDVGAAIAGALSVRGRHPSEVTLLLREVHALGAADQTAVGNLVAAWYAGRGAPRIISTCSVSLFDRVLEGAFDEQLFYSLNALHIVVRTRRE